MIKMVNIIYIVEKTFIVEFNYSNIGEYYINKTSPIYPTIKVELTKDSSNEVTLKIINTLDTFNIPHEFPFPYTKDSNDTSVPNYNYSINEGSFFKLTRLNGVYILIINRHLSLKSLKQLFYLYFILNYIQHY